MLSMEEFQDRLACSDLGFNLVQNGRNAVDVAFIDGQGIVNIDMELFDEALLRHEYHYDDKPYVQKNGIDGYVLEDLGYEYINSTLYGRRYERIARVSFSNGVSMNCPFKLFFNGMINVLNTDDVTLDIGTCRRVKGGYFCRIVALSTDGFIVEFGDKTITSVSRDDFLSGNIVNKNFKLKYDDGFSIGDTVVGMFNRTLVKGVIIEDLGYTAMLAGQQSEGYAPVVGIQLSCGIKRSMTLGNFKKGYFDACFDTCLAWDCQVYQHQSNMLASAVSCNGCNIDIQFENGSIIRGTTILKFLGGKIREHGLCSGNKADMADRCIAERLWLKQRCGLSARLLYFNNLKKCIVRLSNKTIGYDIDFSDFLNGNLSCGFENMLEPAYSFNGETYYVIDGVDERKLCSVDELIQIYCCL